MVIVNEKIGIYTEDEILEHLAEGEGRSFLGRSMYDAIFDKIHALKTENEQLKQENSRLKDKIDKAVEYIKNIDKFEERLNDDTRIYMIQDADVDEIERILKEN